MSIEAVFISFIMSLYAQTIESPSSVENNEGHEVHRPHTAQSQEVLDILSKLKIGEPKNERKL